MSSALIWPNSIFRGRLHHHLLRQSTVNIKIVQEEVIQGTNLYLTAEAKLKAMSVLLFDPSAGAAGDMIMAALLDLGADLDVVRQAVESVGCRLEIIQEEESHIMATRARVISDRRYQSLAEAVSILEGSSLAGIALENALRALDTLAEAESRVHGVPKAEARFHEIGALDALADIAGSCAARHSLAVERVLCRPVSVGGGYV
jgi:pyridinium-3,5-bisthiocarboxylic acid mononucleotide nickel chelatase